jgi:hypothetical protein
LMYLEDNRVGFASAFFKQASKLGQIQAQKYYRILSNPKLSLENRINKILNHHKLGGVIC